MGHRCELSFKDAVRTVPIHKRLDEFLVGIYYFFQIKSAQPLQPQGEWKSSSDECLDANSHWRHSMAGTHAQGPYQCVVRVPSASGVLWPGAYIKVL